MKIMKKYKIIGFLLITAISLTFCAMKQELQKEFPQEIQAVFYEKEKNGAESSRTHFYMEFKKPLATNIKLQNIYFRNQDSPVQEITNNTFVAHLFQSIIKEVMIMDNNPAKEYGNKAPVIKNSKFNLKPNEAVLEYKKDNKTVYYKITNVKEKPVR